MLKPLCLLLVLNIVVTEMYHWSVGASLCCNIWADHKKKYQDPEKAVKKRGFICLSGHIYTEGECQLPDFELPHCFLLPWCQGLFVWPLNMAAWGIWYLGQPGGDGCYYVTSQKEALVQTFLLYSRSHHTSKTLQTCTIKHQWELN